MARARRSPPGWKLTPAKKTKLIELLASGVDRSTAAEAVGTTGRKIRAMMRPDAPNYDARVAADLQAAIDDGDTLIAERLSAEGLRRQLDDESKMTDRGLHNERIYRDPAYRAAHRPRVEHSGADGGPLEVVLSFMTPPVDGDKA